MTNGQNFTQQDLDAVTELARLTRARRDAEEALRAARLWEQIYIAKLLRAGYRPSAIVRITGLSRQRLDQIKRTAIEVSDSTFARLTWPNCACGHPAAEHADVIGECVHIAGGDYCKCRAYTRA